MTETVEKLVKSKEWAEILKQRGWEDFYLAGERLSKPSSRRSRLASATSCKSIGLVKS